MPIEVQIRNLILKSSLPRPVLNVQCRLEIPNTANPCQPKSITSGNNGFKPMLYIVW
jgi:hypothetical protein